MKTTAPPGATYVVAITARASPAATRFKMGGDRGCEPMARIADQFTTAGVASTAF